MKEKHYMCAISPGPLMIVRVPWPMPLWRHIMRAMTAVMQSHGMRQKDLSALTSDLVDFPLDRAEDEIAFANRIDAGYGGSKFVVPGFLLYDWQGGAFKLVRGATAVTS